MNNEKPYFHMKDDYTSDFFESTGFITRYIGFGCVRIRSLETGKYHNRLFNSIELQYDLYTKEEFQDNFPEYFI